jgi:predicted nucleotidyltransferase
MMSPMEAPGSRHAPPSDILALARQVAGIVRRATRSPGYRVFLFGSHVSGEAGPRSDIDIGIEGPAPLDADVMQAIREACERLPDPAHHRPGRFRVGETRIPARQLCVAGRP